MRRIAILIVAVLILSGCSTVNKNLEQALIDSEPIGIDKVASIENATNSVPVLATSTRENREEPVQAEIIANKKVSLIIDFGEEKKTALVEFKDGMTVADLLQAGTKKLGLALETKSYSIGVFVEAIGDKKNGQENNYWTYYVNDKFANVAADKYELQAGDRVEWKFSKSPF